MPTLRLSPVKTLENEAWQYAVACLPVEFNRLSEIKEKCKLNGFKIHPCNDPKKPLCYLLVHQPAHLDLNVPPGKKAKKVTGKPILLAYIETV